MIYLYSLYTKYSKNIIFKYFQNFYYRFFILKNKKSQCENGLLFRRIKQFDISLNFNLLGECDSPIDTGPLPNKPHQNGVPQCDSKAHVHGEDGECEVEVVAGCGIGLDDEALAGRGVKEEAWLDEGDDLACDVCCGPDPDCL